MRTIKSNIVVVLLLLVVAFSSACNSCAPRQQMVQDWQEYQEPFYPNQQPSWVDGDYYIFVSNGQYRRVRRTYIPYANPVIIPIMPDVERTRVYQSIPKVTVPASRTGSSASNLTSPSSSTVPSSRSLPSKPNVVGGSTVPSSRSTSTVPSSRSSSTSSSSSSSSSRSTVPSSRRK